MNICDLCQLSSPSGCTKLSNENCLKDALKLIKATVTNGDIVQAVYPHYTFEIESFEGFVRCSYDGWYIRLPICWWDAPYKEGDTEESDSEFMCRVMSKTINKSTDDRNFIGGF